MQKQQLKTGIEVLKVLGAKTIIMIHKSLTSCDDVD